MLRKDGIYIRDLDGGIGRMRRLIVRRSNRAHMAVR